MSDQRTAMTADAKQIEAALRAQLDPQSVISLEVGHQLDAICTCGVPDGESVASDPNVRSVLLPHHHDCAAVEAWPVVKALAAHLAAITTEPGLAESLRELHTDPVAHWCLAGPLGVKFYMDPEDDPCPTIALLPARSNELERSTDSPSPRDESVHPSEGGQ